MLYGIYTTKEAALIFRKSEATIKRICKDAWERNKTSINIGTKRNENWMEITKFGSSWMLIEGEMSDIIKIQDARAEVETEIWRIEKTKEREKK